MSAPRAEGTVASFDDASGLGSIRVDDGADVPFHCVEIADGTRTIAADTAVEFSWLPKLGQLEAADIRPR